MVPPIRNCTCKILIIHEGGGGGGGGRYVNIAYMVFENDFRLIANDSPDLTAMQKDPTFVSRRYGFESHRSTFFILFIFRRNTSKFEIYRIIQCYPYYVYSRYLE